MEIFPLIWLGVTIVAAIALFVLRPNHHVTWLVVIVLMTAFSIWASLPNNPGIRVDLNGDGGYEIDKPIAIRQGLDLAGGLKVLLQADVPPDTSLPRSSMEEVRRIVENRIDALGALEPVVQLQGDRRIIIEIPGYEDPESAVSLVRQTALLEFVDFGSVPLPDGTVVQTDYQAGSSTDASQTPTAAPEATPADAAAAPTEVPVGPIYHTVFAGDILQTADVGLDNQTTNPLVTFILTPEGSTLFADYTTSHTGQYLGIVLDGVVLSSPRIQQPITGGNGSITGSFTLEEATQLATQLRYGALPVPLRVESTSTIGPTLGQISVDQSIRAGVIGIVVVLIFMLVYYRMPGISAALALIIFALFNLTIYKLVPVTMTLPAITGFLISVGTAVDGNILIFERMKEELRHGKRLGQAVDAGFNRAWTSIRDSNFSTIIICAVLYAFGTSFGAGAVRGFAVTLALGLIVNLFTAVTVTRTFLHFIMLPLSDGFAASNRWLLGLSREA